MEGIKAGDLRLGNLVEQGHVSAICYEVGFIGCWINQSPYDSSAGEFYKMDSIKPIPLTEDWLKRFGFEIDKSLTNNITAKMPIHENRQLLIKSGFIADDGLENFWVGINGHIANVKFVHQLMNLYFAITQTELTINNP